MSHTDADKRQKMRVTTPKVCSFRKPAKGTEKAADKTGDATKTAATKTGHATRTVGHDTGKGRKSSQENRTCHRKVAADKTGHAVKTGAKDTGRLSDDVLEPTG